MQPHSGSSEQGEWQVVRRADKVRDASESGPPRKSLRPLFSPEIPLGPKKECLWNVYCVHVASLPTFD